MNNRVTAWAGRTKSPIIISVRAFYLLARPITSKH